MMCLMLYGDRFNRRVEPRRGGMPPSVQRVEADCASHSAILVACRNKLAFPTPFQPTGWAATADGRAATRST